MLLTCRTMVSKFCPRPMAAGNHAVTPGLKSLLIDFSWEDTMVSACVWHLIMLAFQTHADGDIIVVRVAFERWHKGLVFSKVKCRYHRNGPLLSYCASVCMCSKDPCAFLLHFLEVHLFTHYQPGRYILNVILDLGNLDCVNATSRKLIRCLYGVFNRTGGAERSGWRTVTSEN